MQTCPQERRVALPPAGVIAPRRHSGASAHPLAAAAGGSREGLEGQEEHTIKSSKKKVTFLGIIIQIMIFDIVFSLDSVITAIGLADDLPVMVIAIMIAVMFMIFLSGTVSRFVEEHPTFKILALSFLILIGTALVGEGLDLHIPKGYIYFAMAFSAFVEVLNMKLRKRAEHPVKLHSPRMSSAETGD